MGFWELEETGIGNIETLVELAIIERGASLHDYCLRLAILWIYIKGGEKNNKKLPIFKKRLCILFASGICSAFF